MTGGEELTVTSTAAATTISNVHFEVIGFTSLILDIPDLTVAGIYQSVRRSSCRTWGLEVGSYVAWGLAFMNTRPLR